MGLEYFVCHVNFGTNSFFSRPPRPKAPGADFKKHFSLYDSQCTSYIMVIGNIGNRYEINGQHFVGNSPREYFEASSLSMS